jgi:hypothetical protein
MGAKGMKLTVEHLGGAADGRRQDFEMKVGDAIAWHDGPAPVSETDPPLVTFIWRAPDHLHAVVRMRP